MPALLYNQAILRLAASIPYDRLLADAQAVCEKRSPVCGSRVTVGISLDGGGLVSAIGQEVRACALGQASASLMGASAVGRTPAELADASNTLTAYLAGERADPGDWPGLKVFGPARDYTARHASIRLAFEAAAEAAREAMTIRADPPA